MHIAVTGGAGFIGRTIVQAAHNQGHQVTIIDRQPLPVPQSDQANSGTRIVADLADDSQTVAELLSSADAVIHLAASPGVRDSSANITQQRYRDNVLATHIVCQRTPLATPLIAFSSSSVYGGAHHIAGQLRPCAELDALNPQGGYAASKVAAEAACAQRAHLGGHVLRVRPFTVVGEHQRADMALALWAHKIRAAEPITIFGGTDRSRDFTDVRDVATATLALLHAEARGVVNLGTGQGHTLHTVIHTLVANLGIPAKVQVVPANPREVQHTLADVTRLHTVIGWQPRTDLAAVIDRMRRTLPPTTQPMPCSA